MRDRDETAFSSACDDDAPASSERAWFKGEWRGEGVCACIAGLEAANGRGGDKEDGL